MIVSILVLIFFILAIYLLSNITGGVLNTGTHYLFQDFSKTDVPYIHLDIQGQTLNMLVDTGCAVSIIRKDVVDELQHEKSPRKISLESLTPDSLATEVVSIPFKIGTQEVKEDFAVYDEKDIANFGILYGVDLHGILGGEFLQKTNCKIDYKKNILIVP